MSLSDWNLPWPELRLPPYRSARWGDWHLKKLKQVEQFGYYQDWHGRADMYVLFKGEISWMSSARDEIDSQAPFVAAAFGHTVVMGAGMGIVLFNLLSNPHVTRLTLVEWDPQVPQLLEKCSRFSKWPGIDKLRIEMTDALAYHPNAPVDMLYADIWATPGEPQTVSQMQHIQRQVRAARLGWWGQEIHYLEWLKAHTGIPALDSYRAWARELTLPLIEQDNPNYIAAVKRVSNSYCYRSFLQDPVRNAALVLN